MTEYRTMKITMTLENFNRILLAERTAMVEQGYSGLIKHGEISGATLRLVAEDYLAGVPAQSIRIAERTIPFYHEHKERERNDKKKRRPSFPDPRNEDPGEDRGS
mgnify:CR=1 FL=1